MPNLPLQENNIRDVTLVEAFNLLSKSEDCLNDLLEYLDTNRDAFPEEHIEAINLGFNALVDIYDEFRNLLDREVDIFNHLPLWYDINNPDVLLLDGVPNPNIRRFNPNNRNNNDDDVFEL